MTGVQPGEASKCGASSVINPSSQPAPTSNCAASACWAGIGACAPTPSIPRCSVKRLVAEYALLRPGAQPYEITATRLREIGSVIAASTRL